MMHRFHMNRTILLPACALAALLAAAPCLAPSARAASLTVIGGSGGGGGGGEGAATQSYGGATVSSFDSYNGNGGMGGIGATGTGNAGGGGGAGSINATDGYQSARNGSAASGATGGAGGNAVGIGGDGGAAANVGFGSGGGAGGNGANATLDAISTTSTDNIGVFGGNGGQGGQGGANAGANGGDGGKGGNATLGTNAISVSGNVTVGGGKGNDAAPASAGSGISGTGGRGGDAAMAVNGMLTATSLSVTSGSVGDGTGGTGGNASFVATTLAAPSISLSKNYGSNTAFRVDTLDATSGDTELTLDRTTAGTSGTNAGDDGVYIGTAKLGDGTLEVTRSFANTGAARIETLLLTGSGTFDDTDNPITLGRLAIDGGTLKEGGNWNGILNHAYTTSPAITINNGGATFDVSNASYLGHTLEGAGGLTKTGEGLLELDAANTYSGGTTVSAGTLVLRNPDATGAGTVTVGALSRTRAASPANAINGSGDVAANPGNGNTLTLSGTNAYTGMTTVRSGTLALGNNLASNQLTLNGGTTFNRGSYSHSLDNGVLNVDGSNGQSATYTGNLSATNATLNFISPVNPSQPLLTISGDADVSGSAYNVGLAGGTSLATGSTLTLLEVGAGKTLTANNLRKGGGIVQIGSTVAHDITTDVTLDPATGRLNAVTARVSPGRATNQSKALSEGFLGGMALSLQGADLVAGRGTEAAVQSARSADNMGFAGFGALSGGSLRYNTGSHLDMRSLSLLTGLARGVDLTPGRLTVGAFFEYGNGSYDTHNSFSNAASVDGDGNAYYLGGGILARMDFSNTGPGRFYAEASGRAGKTHNEYDSSDLRDAQGRKAEYDSDSPYYGLHFGAGYIWNINDAASLDLYGKYFWTRQEGDSVGLSTGEHLSFDDADSSRLRFGGRFAYTLNEHVAPYVGAAWEHEFDGKARGTTNGFDIDAPNLRGDTGIGELGLSLTPSVDLPLTVDLGVQGYTGKREGVTGSVQMKWEF